MVSAANEIRADRKPDCWTLDLFRPGLRQEDHLLMIGPRASQGLRALHLGERKGFFFSY